MLEKLRRAISILQCPRTGTSLSIHENEIRSASGEIYPIVEGKPILVRRIEDLHTTPPTDAITSQNNPDHTPNTAKSGWKIHLGSGNVACADPMVLSFDILPLANVDIVAEAEDLPLMTGSIAHVDSGAVFEHLYDPLKAAAEVRRVLADGGASALIQRSCRDIMGFRATFSI